MPKGEIQPQRIYLDIDIYLYILRTIQNIVLFFQQVPKIKRGCLVVDEISRGEPVLNVYEKTWIRVVGRD